ncbi:MAG: TIGR00266 family protein [Blastocatellia bacterium]
MKCQRCGADVTPDTRFCTTCGNPVGAPDAPTNYPPPGYQQGPPPGYQQGPPPGYQQGPPGYPPPPSPPPVYPQGPPPGYGQGAPNYNQGQPNYGGGQPGYPPGQGIHIDADGRGSGRGYNYEILHQPAFSLAVVQLQPEQSIQAEAGAMVSMSANVELQSQMKGGLMGAFKRAVGGESAFVSTFTARGGPGEVTFAPGSPGDIAALEMSNQMFYVQSSSYLAGDGSLIVDTKWGGAKSFFGGEGLFVLQVRGTGLLLVSSFGAIHRKTLAPGERYIVDTGHLVAWEGTTQYSLRKAASGWFRSMVSGEGIVADFIGPGELLIQTRNLAAFAGLMKPFFPNQSSGGGGGFSFGSS